MTLDFPIVPVKLILGRGKEKEPVAAPTFSTLVFDGRDAAIFCLGFALIFSVLAVIFLAACRQTVVLGLARG